MIFAWLGVLALLTVGFVVPFANISLRLFVRRMRGAIPFSIRSLLPGCFLHTRMGVRIMATACGPFLCSSTGCANARRRLLPE